LISISACRAAPAYGLDPHDDVWGLVVTFPLLTLVTASVVEGIVEIMGGMSKGRLFATFFSLASVAAGIAVQVCMPPRARRIARIASAGLLQAQPHEIPRAHPSGDAAAP
jgi:hypothetical protein